MTLLKKIFFITAIALTIFFPKNVIAQCLNPAWNASGTYSAGDVVSDDGKDWEAIPSGQYFRRPSGASGEYGWTEVSNPCASATAPVVDATLVRATYCNTSFGVGTITNNGGATITARGFVFSLTPNPTLTNDAVLLDAGTGVGDEFEGLMEDLTPETTYYIRTYATNSEGTTYGTETSFTTRATSDCVTECALACDMTDANLLDPTSTEWSSPSFATITKDDTICVTQDVTISGTISLQGMLKICNGAQITLSGSIDVEREFSGNPAFIGQVVYEGCDEIFDGNGSYTGEWTGTENDPKQMISYCETCVDNDQSQFFKPTVSTAFWGATCRPTSTLVNPLPVELTKFTTESHTEGVALNWTTSSEINNSHFEIELSYDGVNWFTIGIVQGAGNSMEINDYQFIDNQIGSGIQYYRLKQVDFDGTESYSNINYFSFDNASKPTSFIAYQNQNNKVEVQAVFSGMGEALLIDTRGRIIERLTFISTDKGGLQLEFESTNLSEGVYFVKIQSSNASLGQKVQIVK